ncbi:MAG: protein kinase, partial [Planctomycetes bacterium]|nr:protein kinase [Planctomycetota bacterium]
MSDRSSTDHEAEHAASEIWIDFLGKSHADDEREFAALCEEHPELADELRQCRAGYEKIGDLLAVFGEGRGHREYSAHSEGARTGDRVGDYELVRRLARGGQGEVWEARQLSLDRSVALKLVRPDRVSEKTLALFAREARAGGRLAHAGIVAVHDHGESEGRHWIAQELIEEGRTLRDFLDDRRQESELPDSYYRDVAALVAELAEALQSAHELGVIHRDVKPGNVLITVEGHPKLTDFGLARITDETAVSVSGDVAGTWLYMSPEQVGAKRSEIDHRTDVFSLGVVLYELLTMQRPFDGDSTQQIASRILFRDPPDVRSIRSRIPPDLAVICTKALEKSKARRYSTMAEFAADLRRYLASEPILARPLGPLDHARRWARGHPMAGAVGLTAALMLAAVSGLAWNIDSNNTEIARQSSDLETKTLAQQIANADLDRATRELEASQAASTASKAAARRDGAAATRSLKEVLRLSLSRDHVTLVHDANILWPAWPERIADLESWQARAEALVGELPGLRETLTRLEEQAAAETEPDSRTTWWRNQLRGLIERLESLTNEKTGLLAEDGVSTELGWSVPRRLAFARRLREGFSPGGEFLVRWEAAMPAIRETYPGLELPVQMGLVPMSPDPESGLWEFWHVSSGTEPLRGDDGVLNLGEGSGIVLVLLHGGAFWMGASADLETTHNYDPDASAEECPVHEVELSPFFLSKYEMT